MQYNNQKKCGKWKRLHIHERRVQPHHQYAYACDLVPGDFPVIFHWIWLYRAIDYRLASSTQLQLLQPSSPQRHLVCMFDLKKWLLSSVLFAHVRTYFLDISTFKCPVFFKYIVIYNFYFKQVPWFFIFHRRSGGRYFNKLTQQMIWESGVVKNLLMTSLFQKYFAG